MQNAAPVGRSRILVSFPFSEKGGWFIPLGEGCASALDELGFDVVRFNPVVEIPPVFPGRKLLERMVVFFGRLAFQAKSRTKQRLPWTEEAIRFRSLIDLARRTEPETLLVISTYTYPEYVLQRLKRECGVKRVLGWCVEGPIWMRSPIEESKLYDHYFCTYPIKTKGASRVTHLSALVFDPELFRPLNPRPAKDVDIVFVGRPKTRRARILEAISDFRPMVFGPGWVRECPALAPCVGGEQVSGDDLNRLYNRSKIVLNISAWENEIADCPNLRIVDVPASGSFLLSDYSAAAAELFEPGREVEFYRDAEELRDKLAYYLAHDAARERIARAGYEKARTLGSYRDKMAFILEVGGIPRPSGPRPSATFDTVPPCTS
jgi:spore maturation protein CgeB